jgi:hypothetical protein
MPSQPSTDNEDESVLDSIDQQNRPADVALQQQRIKAWHPILDPEWVIYGYLLLAVIMIPVGKSIPSYLILDTNRFLSLTCLHRSLSILYYYSAPFSVLPLTASEP